MAYNPHEDFSCPPGKCLLCVIYPRSDAGLACDDKCYFSKGEPGEHQISYILKHYRHKWESLQNKTDDDKSLP